MDSHRRMPGRDIRLTFALGGLFILCLLLAHAYISIRLHASPPPAHLPFNPRLREVMEKQRSELYDRMATDLDTNGIAYLDGGNTSQSLKLSDLFETVDDRLIPVHKPAIPPVRACVLHLEHQYASKIDEAVRLELSPHFPKGVWYQDPETYHFSLFHASHHLDPVPANETEVEAESAAVEQVAARCCPLEIVMERVVLTSTGVLLGCWQVRNGTDPAVIRKELSHALPRAPAHQIYSPEILHTSLARIVGPPELPNQGSVSKAEMQEFFRTLVQQLNIELSSFQAIVRDLWFVEEIDVLALALKGRVNVRRFPLQCSSSS